MFCCYIKSVPLAFMLLQLSTLAYSSPDPENGCKGLQDGKKYLISDNGKMLSRCEHCGTAYKTESSVSVHGKHGDEFAQWTFEPVGDKCAIKSDIGLYVSRCRGCWEGEKYPDSVFNHIKVADRSSPYALWKVEKHSDSSYSFEADTGMYLARCHKCVPDGTEENFAFVHGANCTGPALWQADDVKV